MRLFLALRFAVPYGVLAFLLAAPALLAQPLPDTTAPWRYFPLAVGNVWEYDFVDNGQNPPWTERQYVEKDTVVAGHRYFVLNQLVFNTEGVPFPPARRDLFRFDTLAAQVIWRLNGEELAYTCPLDAAFNSVIPCQGQQTSVEGGYDEVVVFEDEEGPDTVRTAVKTYAHNFGLDARYAAGIGPLYRSCMDCPVRTLRAAIIDGVEYGEVQYPPVSAEPGAPVAAFALAVSPNPARGSTTLSLTLLAPGSVRVAVYDARGREVAVVLSGARAAGRHAVAFDAAALPGGVYFARAEAGGAVVTRPITIVR